ncbi:thyroglobulin [Rhineura floridana]|uniref:thyroglobulin n=1 Tax=Rhineura floridana TaxID=261503 RepID=UPI002AC84F83|nr:thyroglobulin [Rhineura floridana]
MGPLLLITLLCFINLASADLFEYQVESKPLRPCELQRAKAFQEGEDYVPQCLEDGQFRNIQCDKNGASCWCIDDKGAEIAGSKQTRSSVACLSFCQLQKQQTLIGRSVNSSAASYIPQCLDSGEFDPIQCDFGLDQCWCVDAEGMEIYGTRQRGKPKRCPRKCEIRDRRILHNVGEKSPPQCSAEGEFLPVQCKFINTTDKMVFDLVHHFSRFPEAFLTFRSFSSMFPEVSGYCYCVDSLGRELEDSGLEMLLENVYDTVFASLEPVATFSETSMYRILQRRFLGVQLATTGRFRCPSKCETERFTAIRFEQNYRPLCDDSGAYKPTQQQPDGQCWCVDAKGQELLGTRRKRQCSSCGEELSCVSERQQALSRLFYGPVGHFSQHSLFSAAQEPQQITGSSRSCPPSFRELFVDSGLVSSIIKKSSDFQLLTLESVLSEAIGGMFPSRDLARVALQFTSNPKRFQENLFGGKFLKNLVHFNFSGALGPNGKFNLDRYFQQIGMRGGFTELAQQLSLEVPQEKFNLSQPLVDSFGRTINFQDNQNAVSFLASLLQAPEFFTFLQHVISVPESIAEDLGDVARTVLKSKDCTERGNDLFVPVCTEEGNYKEVQCYSGFCWCVDSSGNEIPGSRVSGAHPRCPTMCERQRESLQRLKRSQPAGSELFVPSCTQEGKFLPVQCHGRNCFCVNSEGRAIPGIGANTGQPMQCPSDCQLAGGQTFLRTVQQLLQEPSSLPTLSSVYIPQCSVSGEWKQVQCNGPPEQAFEWYQRWIAQNNNGRALPFVDLMDILLDYKERSQRSFEDFVKILYEAGHQNIFPEFSKFHSLEAVPQEVLAGKTTVASSQNMLLEPFTFWQLLHGHLTHYPGSYSDFSTPLGHFDLRNCWCADEKGQMHGKKAEVNEIPDCPGECEASKRDALQFINEVEQLIKNSNSSHFPFGESFLMAKTVTLTDDELLYNASQSESITISERLLMESDYAIQLAAQSTLHFYWRSFLSSHDSAGEAVRLGFQPYIPQCDGLGNWLPVQCYDSSGHCWCVDERGRYVLDSLVTRSTQLPRCQTPCQLSQANAWLSSWRLPGLKANVTSGDLFTPSCLENGGYTVLQKSDTRTWCVDPTSGEAFQQSDTDSNGFANCPSYCSVLKSKALLREIGQGYIPQCETNIGGFSPVQCSEEQESCWCAFENGEEAPGTRVSGEKPACQRPQCRLPFEAPYVINGGIFCSVSVATPKTQQCQVVCSPGSHSVFSRGEPLLCDTETHLWLGDPPHPQTCQRLQPFQSVQMQTQFQLLLPPGKACGPDFTGLLGAFQIFILDEMKAHGFCHVQVNALGHLVSVPVCDDSAVLVQCLAVDRLGVNITWRALLENVPVASLPDLHDIEKALVGDNLVGRFEELIKSGGFVLHFDNEQFQADTSISLLRNEDFDVSAEAHVGCKSGFRKVLDAGEVAPNPRGCVVCPPGTFFQNDSCIPCPSGFYQDQAGSFACLKCPLGKSTASTGAFRAEYCIAGCQMDNQSVRCDENGQYRPSYEDPATKKSFCVDSLGRVLDWTETDGPVTDSQCLVFRRFERAPASKLSFTTEEVETVGSKIIQGEPESVLQECMAECEKDESCGFLTLSAAGTGMLCELYSARESNYNCSISGLVQGAWDNAATTSVAHLSCLAKVKIQDKDVVRVYLKKGHEFTTAGVKTFEMTDFQDVVSGVYSTLVLSAAGTSLTDVHLFCRQACSQDACCDGFALSQIILGGGSILCGLMSYPDALICNVNSWDGSSTREQGDTCQRLKYNEGKKQYVFSLGGQVLTGTSELTEKPGTSFASFQRVYLWRDSDMITRVRSSVCSDDVTPTQMQPLLPASTMELFSLMESSQILINHNRSLPFQEYWLFKPRYSAEQALLWCLARCAEDEFCQLADVPNITSGTFFPCTLYPVALVCDNSINNIPENCNTVLPQKPHLLYQKTVSLEGSIKNFYTRLPFHKVSGISVRNKMDVSGKTVSNGFFDCEHFCDADPCCMGFGLLNASQRTGGKVLCLVLNSLGIQTCSGELRKWQLSDCASLEAETRVHPFGWYQRAANIPHVCPAVVLPESQENVTTENWQLVDGASALIDPSMSTFDIMHITRDDSSDFTAIQDFCLSVCSKDKSCLVTTLELQPSSTRCIFYPETQACTLGLQGHHCRLLLKEPATYIYRKQEAFLPIAETNNGPSVYIPLQGTLFGTSQVIQVGSNWKSIGQFLGIPYAAPPVAENRFRPPQAFTWVESWNATTTRASCWQPGDGEASPSSISEDCLYLNVYVPPNTGGNLPVLVFFHNGVSGEDQPQRKLIDGSYLAGTGNIIVVTANYRVGVFGFLSTGSSVASGNWGLLDQDAALKWTQKNIASFGGDPGQITIAADRSGADVSSIHLLSGYVDPGVFQRALLMGGSAFSPVSAISQEKARTQAAVLARELGCPSASSEETASCLRQLPAKVLNDAQTRLLAISGPFQYWSPVVDGFYLQEPLTAALQRSQPLKVDLLIGSAQQDGLINRAMAIKRFEVSQGRANSKIAFYLALQNSLGGEDANPAVLDAATWFYSLTHSSTEYASFSRALENATRDQFIICPTIAMARHWASNDRGKVFMYHVPESSSLSSSSLEFLPDVQYAFGLPFHPQYENQYTLEEKSLSLAIMQYMANFIKSGNPNGPYRFSRKVAPIASPWPMFRADADGDNYKEFTASLENRKGLKKAECSFWSDYIKTLKTSMSCRREQLTTSRPSNEFLSKTTELKPLGDKVAYKK